ncbi:hypothetical protein HERIO_271 [Hepatospora eriocheir]|uniref:Uncharacterized protein n=1 Tax=Hepatospora eriocheir TaxID=1081669 RepID=A0A1X0QDY1_9MICR|nr:hypothetical protein HERIO_271 [Hepatospora eriocheir]
MFGNKKFKLKKYETKSDALTRLKDIKELNNKLNDLTEEMKNKSKDEFSFDYYSTLDNKKKVKYSENELKLVLNYINHEIRRVEKVLIKNPPLIKNKKFFFTEEEVFVSEIKKELNEDFKEFEIYLENLIKKKREISNKLNLI